MKLIPLATPQHHTGHPGEESLSGPMTAPETQSDAQRSNFIPAEKIPSDSRMVTSEFHIEFSPTEPTSPNRGEPTGKEAAKWRAQIRAELQKKRLSSKA